MAVIEGRDILREANFSLLDSIDKIMEVIPNSDAAALEINKALSEAVEAKQPHAADNPKEQKAHADAGALFGSKFVGFLAERIKTLQILHYPMPVLQAGLAKIANLPPEEVEKRLKEMSKGDSAGLKAQDELAAMIQKAVDAAIDRTMQQQRIKEAAVNLAGQRVGMNPDVLKALAYIASRMDIQINTIESALDNHIQWVKDRGERPGAMPDFTAYTDTLGGHLADAVGHDPKLEKAFEIIVRDRLAPVALKFLLKEYRAGEAKIDLSQDSRLSNSVNLEQLFIQGFDHKLSARTKLIEAANTAVYEAILQGEERKAVMDRGKEAGMKPGVLEAIATITALTATEQEKGLFARILGNEINEVQLQDIAVNIQGGSRRISHGSDIGEYLARAAIEHPKLDEAFAKLVEGRIPADQVKILLAQERILEKQSDYGLDDSDAKKLSDPQEKLIAAASESVDVAIPTKALDTPDVRKQGPASPGRPPRP